MINITLVTQSPLFRFNVLLVVFLLFCFIHKVCGQAKKGSKEKQINRPNILWIIADDLSPDLGSYGNSLVHTPNTDNLASEGRRYMNVFATNPICSPSRSAFYTGMYQTTIGAQQHRTYNKSPLPDSVKLITKYFRSAGYFTSNGEGTPESDSGKTDFNFLAKNKFDGTDWSQREDGQPFFATVQIHNPHRPFVEDKKHPIDPDNVKIPPYYPDTPLIRKDWSNYLEDVQIMDRKVGKVLRRLKEEGLANKTIVFFFGDQGRPQLRAKQWLYDKGIRVPLIVRWPGKFRESTSAQLLSLIDVSATSLKAAGIDIPRSMQGINFSEGQSRKHIFAARNRADGMHDYMRAVRDKHFKYIRNYMPENPYDQFGHYKLFFYPALAKIHLLHQQGKLTPAQELYMQDCKPDEELYDIQKDPWEIHNLANDPAYMDTLRRMRTVLNDWEKRTHDRGNHDPDPDSLIYVHRESKYQSRWKKRGFSNPRDIDYEKYVQWWKKHLHVE